MGSGADIFLDRPKQEDEQRLREVVCERGSVGICCHESPHGEAVDPPLRTFHTASKKNSPKFTVATGSSTQRQPHDKRLWRTPLGSKRSDLILFVALLCIKGLRLVTGQLPENSWAIGPVLNRTSPVRCSRKSAFPRSNPLSLSIRVREDSCTLAKHLFSLRFVRRLPVTRSLRPTQLAHGPTHGGHGNPDPLLALPQLAVAL